MPNRGLLNLNLDEFQLRAEYRDDMQRLNLRLGELLREQGGEELVALTRSLCEDTEGCHPKELFERHPKLRDVQTTQRILRALTVLCQLLNTAQQKEIVRATRARHEHADAPPRAESIHEAIRQLKSKGTTPEQMQQLLDRAEVCPTLTAHPTEARRRSVLEKLEMATEALVEADAPHGLVRLDRPVNDRDWAQRELHAVLTLLWQTDELRAFPLTVENEVQNALYFFDRNIMPAVAWVHDSMRIALEAEYPGHEFNLPPLVRYHSWVGGDRDGNPKVTPEVTWNTLLMHKRTAIEHYTWRLKRLQRLLTNSQRLVGASPELLASIERDSVATRVGKAQANRFRFEPYRHKLSIIVERLGRTLAHLDDVELHGPDEPVPPGAYKDAEEFLADLRLVQDSLRENQAGILADEGRLALVVEMVRAFGFHLARLDVRQHSEEHEAAVDELMRVAGVHAHYASLHEEDKVALLTRELGNPRPLVAGHYHPSERTANVLQVMRIIRKAQRSLSHQSVGLYVISMTHGVSDMLEVMLLAKEAGLIRLEGGFESDIDIVPLFETINDLDHCAELLEGMFTNEAYKKQLEARGTFQEVMLGYSDSTKDGGYLSANLMLYLAHERVSEVCRKHKVDFRFFHGRGGAIGRGGGRANMAILSQPPGSINGRIRFTEQGEVIAFRYGLAPFAHRHLEQMVHAVLLAESRERAPEDHRKAWTTIFQQMADHSMTKYRDLVLGEEHFWEFYVQATPIRHISKLPIASRPVFRPGGSLVGLDNLRAIPWVFSWTQSRYGIPGWYGLGKALEWWAERPGGLDELRQMYREWTIFSIVLDNAQSDMLRSDSRASAWYAELVEPREMAEHLHGVIEEERERTRKWIAIVTGQERLGDKIPIERATIALREPVLLALNRLQVALLHHWRQHMEKRPAEESQPWSDAILLSMIGVAAALQSTG